LRFNSPSRHVPENSCLILLRTRPTLMGFCSPTARKTSRAHVLSRERPPEVTQRYARYVSMAPTPPTTVPLAGFSNLSATFLSQCRPAIFRQVALMGFALQGILPSTKPSRFITAKIPSCRSSRWLIHPGPRPEHLWACDTLPRMVRAHTIYRLQGFRPRENRSHHHARLARK
jgi:hypothetical protein